MEHLAMGHQILLFQLGIQSYTTTLLTFFFRFAWHILSQEKRMTLKKMTIYISVWLVSIHYRLIIPTKNFYVTLKAFFNQREDFAFFF